MAGKHAVAQVEHSMAVSIASLGPDTVGIDDDVLLKMADAIPDFAEVK